MQLERSGPGERDGPRDGREAVVPRAGAGGGSTGPSGQAVAALRVPALRVEVDVELGPRWRGGGGTTGCQPAVAGNGVPSGVHLEAQVEAGRATSAISWIGPPGERPTGVEPGRAAAGTPSSACSMSQRSSRACRARASRRGPERACSTGTPSQRPCDAGGPHAGPSERRPPSDVPPARRPPGRSTEREVQASEHQPRSGCRWLERRRCEGRRVPAQSVRRAASTCSGSRGAPREAGDECRPLRSLRIRPTPMAENVSVRRTSRWRTGRHAQADDADRRAAALIDASSSGPAVGATVASVRTRTDWLSSW